MTVPTPWARPTTGCPIITPSSHLLLRVAISAWPSRADSRPRPRLLLSELGQPSVDLHSEVLPWLPDSTSTTQRKTRGCPGPADSGSRGSGCGAGSLLCRLQGSGLRSETLPPCRA